MNVPEEIGKLRMARSDSPEELAARYEREKRAVLDVRERELGETLKPFRVGSVPYLNAVPLTRGLEEEVVFEAPARLAQMLRLGELDAALVSVTEPLLQEGYEILDGIAVASLGEVKSVFLAHRQPLEEIREIYCDPASLTSVQLLKILLKERGLHPELKLLESYEWGRVPDNVLLIGNPAIEFRLGEHEHSLWDLGAAWFELTQLPFVYAVWAIRKDLVQKERLCRLLREGKAFGLETLDAIVADRTEYTLDFRKDYLGWHIHYHLGTDEKRGLARFVALLRGLEVGRVYDPVFIR